MRTSMSKMSKNFFYLLFITICYFFIKLSLGSIAPTKVKKKVCTMPTPPLVRISVFVAVIVGGSRRHIAIAIAIAILPLSFYLYFAVFFFFFFSFLSHSMCLRASKYQSCARVCSDCNVRAMKKVNSNESSASASR